MCQHHVSAFMFLKISCDHAWSNTAELSRCSYSSLLIYVPGSLACLPTVSAPQSRNPAHRLLGHHIRFSFPTLFTLLHTIIPRLCSFVTVWFPRLFFDLNLLPPFRFLVLISPSGSCVLWRAAGCMCVVLQRPGSWCRGVGLRMSKRGTPLSSFRFSH